MMKDYCFCVTVKDFEFNEVFEIRHWSDYAFVLDALEEFANLHSRVFSDNPHLRIVGIRFLQPEVI